MKKLIIFVFWGIVALTSVGTCFADNTKQGSVYYLNFKPESDEAWQKLARLYSEKTGINVKVTTAASNKYWQTLDEELNSAEAPTLFQLAGPNYLKKYINYCFNLENTRIYNELNSEAYALKDQRNQVRGIAYAVEAYGIIVNRDLLEKAGYDVDDIDSFDDLKKVAEDITSRKKELGFAAFCSSGMDNTSDWRFKTHLANMPIHFEYESKNVNVLDEVSGLYLNNLRAIWNLYINNSTCAPSEIASKTVEDARNEFLSGEAAFYQNGSWEYVELTKKNGGFNKYQLAMIPLYFRVGDEGNQGLCTGTENYWCVNRKASARDIKATIDFINWCVTSSEGTTALAQDMGFTIPFRRAAYSENIFVQQDAINTAKGKVPVSWDFVTIPSESWKDAVSKALLKYAEDQNNANWNEVENAFVLGWNN